ncbi:hypothetical protein GCM10023194_07370 [Planotetraspora phitsanulokensis]|uniref:PLL-like beta propeller domain-containing protein n=1 Tax=Planotetraspora phitsanulokensis TaxID=575192 RepID=A0A8J3U606_9ACTN|nr:hypothetical protein [Planotetraspora phitsanulokensis]GII39233.1 hypothetical protein Pph01_42360 [Planotetraspora phitsanulokensis]
MNLIRKRSGRKLLGAMMSVLLLLFSVAVAPGAQAAESDYGPFVGGYGGTTSTTPAVVSIPGRVITVIRNADGTVSWSVNPGINTSNFRPIPGGWRTPFAPTAIAYNGLLHVFIRGSSDNRIYYAILTDDQNNQWTPWMSIPTVTSLGSPSLVVLNGRLHVFYTGMNNRFYRLEYDGSWRVLSTEIPGNGTSASPLTAVQYGGGGIQQVLLLHRGNDNRVYRQTWNPTNNRFDGWRVTGDVQTTVRVAAAADPDYPNVIELAARGTDGLIRLATLTDDQLTYPWHPTIGGNYYTDAAPTLYSPASVAAFVVYLVITLRGYNDMWMKRAL